MGRIDGYSTMASEGKPVHDQQPEHTEQVTQIQASVVVDSEPQQAEEGVVISDNHGNPNVVVCPQINVNPVIQMPVYYPPPPLQPHYAEPYQPALQPRPVECPPPQYPQEWMTGLFDCLDDPENAIITVCCPCVTFGQVAEILDNGRTSCEAAGMIYTCIAMCIGCPCIYSCMYRTKLRGRFGLSESPTSDCVTHCCCEWCALCQEYRELHHRGYNPSAGWMNVGKNQYQQQAMAPPRYQSMS